MKTLQPFLSMLGLALLFSVTQARGQVINVQFTDGEKTPVLNGSTWSSIISPLAYSGTKWNQDFSFGGSVGQTNLAYSDSTDSTPDISTVGFTLTGITFGDFSNSQTPLILPMFNEIEVTSAAMTLTINGLQNGQAYDLYLDSAYNGGNESIITVGSQTPQDVAGTTQSSFISGQNYLEFTAVPVANSIVVTITGDGTGSYGSLSGFQITEAPEPSSLALVSTGAALLLIPIYRRRKLAL